MREIKFRAWDNKREKYWDGIHKSSEVSNDPADNFGQYLGVNVCDPESSTERYTVEQFTGLTDKYGEDIYEGDIVCGVLYNDYSEHVGRILFDYNGYMIVTEEKSMPLQLTELLSVIGHIHQIGDK